MRVEEIIKEIKENVIMGRVDSSDEGFDGNMEGKPGVSELVKDTIKEDIPVKQVIDSLSEAMVVVGQKYDSGEYLIPDMLASAESVGAAMDILEPHLIGADVESKGVFVIATVKGDLHDIGKNIVATMLKGAGYEVKDIGTGVSTEKIVEAIEHYDAKFVGLSALLTTTMIEMQSVIELMESKGIRSKVKVLIGGAPVSSEFAKKIGADVYCKDAFHAIDTLKAMET